MAKREVIEYLDYEDNQHNALTVTGAVGEDTVNLWDSRDWEGGVHLNVETAKLVRIALDNFIADHEGPRPNSKSPPMIKLDKAVARELKSRGVDFAYKPDTSAKIEGRVREDGVFEIDVITDLDKPKETDNLDKAVARELARELEDAIEMALYEAGDAHYTTPAMAAVTAVLQKWCILDKPANSDTAEKAEIGNLEDDPSRVVL